MNHGVPERAGGDLGTAQPVRHARARRLRGPQSEEFRRVPNLPIAV